MSEKTHFVPSDLKAVASKDLDEQVKKELELATASENETPSLDDLLKKAEGDA